MVVSMAAQLGTAPLVMYYFSNFSVYFLLANIIASAVVPLIIALGVLSLLMIPFPTGHGWLAIGLGKLIDVLNLTASEISRWPYARLAASDLTLWEVGAAYMLLFAVFPEAAPISLFLPTTSSKDA